MCACLACGGSDDEDLVLVLALTATLALDVTVTSVQRPPTASLPAPTHVELRVGTSCCAHPYSVSRTEHTSHP